MKTKLLAFTLLICMISFAGFSLTTTDLCQDSNHELFVSIDANDFHGVVDSIVIDFDQNIEKKIYHEKESSDEAFISDKFVLEINSRYDGQFYRQDQRQKLNHQNIEALSKKSEKSPFRLARDGLKR